MAVMGNARRGMFRDDLNLPLHLKYKAPPPEDTIGYDWKGACCGVEMTIRQESMMLEIWLTRAEKADPILQKWLKSVYTTYRAKKYLIAVFESGKDDLYESTRNLLLYNRRRGAEKAVQQEKMRHAAALND